MSERHIYRDSVSGRIVSEDYAKANPDTTTRETVGGDASSAFLVMRSSFRHKERSICDAVFTDRERADQFIEQYRKNTTRNYWVVEMDLDPEFPVYPPDVSHFHMWTNGRRIEPMLTGWHSYLPAKEAPRHFHHPWEQPGDICMVCSVIAKTAEEATSVAAERFARARAEMPTDEPESEAT